MIAGRVSSCSEHLTHILQLTIGIDGKQNAENADDPRDGAARMPAEEALDLPQHPVEQLPAGACGGSLSGLGLNHNLRQGWPIARAWRISCSIEPVEAVQRPNRAVTLPGEVVGELKAGQRLVGLSL